jgi:hypothetical protein
MVLAELHGFNMNTHMHSQFHHIIYHQIPTELHGFNMNTHMHSQFQYTSVIKSQQSPMILTWTHTHASSYTMHSSQPHYCGRPSTKFYSFHFIHYPYLDALGIGLISSLLLVLLVVFSVLYNYLGGLGQFFLGVLHHFQFWVWRTRGQKETTWPIPFKSK